MKKNLHERLNARINENPEFAEAYQDLIFAEIFGEQLQKLRLEQRMTQKDLAQLTGIKQGEISKIENRRTVPSVGSIERILKVFHKRLTIIDM